MMDASWLNKNSFPPRNSFFFSALQFFFPSHFLLVFLPLTLLLFPPLPPQPPPPTIFTLNLYLLSPTPSLRIRPSPSIPPSPFYLLVLKGS